jgi:hypothetical protein
VEKGRDIATVLDQVSGFLIRRLHHELTGA